MTKTFVVADLFCGASPSREGEVEHSTYAVASRVYRTVRTRSCGWCHTEFTTGNRTQEYCSDRCRTDSATNRRDRSTAGEWLRTPVVCGICGSKFYRTKQTGPGRRYCSIECQAKARRRDFESFKAQNPVAQLHYNRIRRSKHGPDRVMMRVRKRHPDLPTSCECCGEDRVLDLAHKPEFARQGSWRTMDKYERHMFWVLCPTCHRVLDGRVETPEQMGLR